MWKWILTAVVACVMCGCTGKAVKDNQPSTDSITGQVSDSSAVVARVQEIYGAVFKAYNLEDSLRNLDRPVEQGAEASRRDFSGNYCSREWNSLVRQIAEIDSLYHAGELGFWEADYWIMAQDWHQLSIDDVKVLSVTPTTASVEFELRNLDTSKPVSLTLVNEDGVWKIDDFVDVSNDHDWKQAMQEYVKEETTNNKK